MDSSRESELRGARLRDAGLVRSEDDSREEGLAMCLPAAEGVDCVCCLAELALEDDLMLLPRVEVFLCRALPPRPRRYELEALEPDVLGILASHGCN